jgi:hypothetical protein
METTLTVLRGHRTRKLVSGVQRYVYPELRITAPVLAAVELQPGDRVRVRTVGARIIVTRVEEPTPSPAGVPQARRQRGAAEGRKAEDGRMSNRGSPRTRRKGGR